MATPSALKISHEGGRVARPSAFKIAHEGAPSKLRLGGDFSSTSTTPVKRESGRFVRAWEVPSPDFVLAGMAGKLIHSQEMRLPGPKNRMLLF